ncbi:polyphosphate kinase 2 family protein [Oceanithermus desulfurans]|uniref:Polyphosphate kinase n=2 Tax=Oceanithermus desulfurans TaxID=227924 RepID=A0A511RLN1_9DEIN|nr:polyphosphate kinase 2 family protein [Oceanithermus desulfurans]MBB6030854.1 PPK2 family polyphosphate:nucleotide phosphotransferase [Oceanithermus desulfurans]GEM90571.1 polyphosphate kinase [Oceanithermus desulfurans NBRC 100063]
MDVSRYRIEPGAPVDLMRWPTREDDGFGGGKKTARKQLVELSRRLGELQARLYAEGRQALLIVLQGMDTAGKDGTIRHVFRAVNPQGVRVTTFKKPTALELAHDYLWRVHRHAPARGEIGIFNRSHYEDVLVVRVHGLVPREVWERRYDHINAFEQLLADEGTRIVKFFLHISKEEQKERLEARLANPEKNWKFNPADLAERKLWDAYTEAYRVMLERTSTAAAPWYAVPADRKWQRNLIVARVLVETLEAMDPRFPKVDFDPRTIRVD